MGITVSNKIKKHTPDLIKDIALVLATQNFVVIVVVVFNFAFSKIRYNFLVKLPILKI